jgi:hypothetical protein
LPQRVVPHGGDCRFHPLSALQNQEDPASGGGCGGGQVKTSSRSWPQPHQSTKSPSHGPEPPSGRPAVPARPSNPPSAPPPPEASALPAFPAAASDLPALPPEPATAPAAPPEPSCRPALPPELSEGLFPPAPPRELLPSSLLRPELPASGRADVSMLLSADGSIGSRTEHPSRMTATNNRRGTTRMEPRRTAIREPARIARRDVLLLGLGTR